MSVRPLRIGIVAGEISGDQLGAGLMRSVLRQYPDAEFVGIGGPQMIAAGCRSLESMDALAIMGLVEGLRHLPGLLALRRRLRASLLKESLDVFVGIDAPDFNLGLERKLKSAGIPAIHYVSPTVWAWRGYRIKHIRKSVSHVLTLFPFEVDYYRKVNVPVTFVGNPLAEKITPDPPPASYRQLLGLGRSGFLLAVLPGSRRGEIQRHTPVILDAIRILHRQHPDWRFVVPFAKHDLRTRFMGFLQEGDKSLPVHYIDGQAREVLAACDAAVVASGTAVMETALIGRPAVVIYRLSRLTAWLVRKLAHVTLFSMPNNLAGRELYPELIQEKATGRNIASTLEALLADKDGLAEIKTELRKMHDDLCQGADDNAARVVIDMALASR